MASWGKADFEQLKQFQKQLQEVQEKELQKFLESCIRELAARLLAKVIERTPVGKGIYVVEQDETGKRVRYKKGKNKGKYKKVCAKVGGTLRRGWTSKTQEEAESRTDNGKGMPEYKNSFKIEKVGGNYTISIINPVAYASYVEFGHRTRGHKRWIPGHFMLTISEKELREAAPGILETKLQQWLETMFQ